MKLKLLTAAVIIALTATMAMASGDPIYTDNRSEVTFMDRNKTPDMQWQAHLRELAPWQNFMNNHGTWFAMFNEENQKPNRAFGQPISSVGATAQERAWNFISNELSDFNIPVAELEFTSSPGTSKHTWVNYEQRHDGLRVLFSRMMVKFNKNNEIIQWGADVFDDITISTIASISSTDAGGYAQSGLTETITGVSISPDLYILPIPTNKKEYEYHLVYEVWVDGVDSETVPSKYWTLVDANTGEVLYRQNFVWHHDHADKHVSKPKEHPVGGNVEVQVNGTIYPTTILDTPISVGLPNVSFTASGTHYTDGTGYVNTGLGSPVTGNFTLSGLWSIVYTGGTTPSGSQSLSTTLNTFDFDADANIKERTAYYHVNVIHDFHKSVFAIIDPGSDITGMDFALPTNIDVAGSCNAFYNGTSINFYDTDIDCYATSTLASVVYHEYGHGINDNFYSDNGSFFINGAMGEGYADVWAMAELEDPYIGVGFYVSGDTMRNYASDPKVYPTDIVGEVHADGEIIAGAWWDTYEQLGSNMPYTMDLFALAYPGFQAQTANGNEGQAFTNVLLDVLEADDDNGNLLDGTPNSAAICAGFGMHGITLISNATLTHTEITTAPETTNITVDANLSLSAPFDDFLDQVYLNYKINGGTWTTVAMPNVGGSQYSVDIPGQPVGTIIAYRISASDNCAGIEAIGLPLESNDANPGLPYFIMVGWDLEMTEDSDFSGIGAWQEGVSGDLATTGMWEVALPLGSFGTPGDASTMVAPDYQHTPGGSLCFVTERAPSASDPVGTADVDGGHTTLRSGVIDLSIYTNPAVTYWRWYDNDPATGANPGNDWWQVQISDDGGSSWTYVENTSQSGKSWQRMAFRVQDYVTVNNNFMIQFIASDSLHPGLGLQFDGGSLVEAAVDDIQIWEEAEPASINDEELFNNVNVFPNPASTEVFVQFDMAEAVEATIEVVNVTGELVYTSNLGTLSQGENKVLIPTESWSEGNYTINVVAGSAKLSRTITVVR